MRPFSIGDLVLTLDPEGIGEVLGYATPYGEAWRWGATTFPKGPVVVNIGRLIAGFPADKLSYPNWNQREALARIWGAVWER